MMLIDCFPSWMTGGGIFAKLTGMPWDSDTTVSKVALDIDFFGKQGNRESSVLLDKMVCLDRTTGLTSVEIGRLCDVIKAKYAYNWGKVWTLMHLTYDPIENYHRHEQESIVDTQTDKHSASVTDIEKNGVNVTETTKQDIDQTVETKHDVDVANERKTSTDLTTTTDVFGMGSSTATPQETVNQSGNSNNNKVSETTTADGDTNKDTQRVTADGDENKTTVTRIADENNNKITRTHTANLNDNVDQHDKTTGRGLEAYGNIGTMTTQDMMQQEIDIRRQHFFDAVVYPDLIKLLTSPVWRLCYEP